MAVALSTFYPRVAPFVLGCPEPSIEIAVRDACIDFAEQTLSWTELLETPVVIAGESQVELTVPANSRLVKLMHVWWGSERLPPATSDDMAAPDVYNERVGTYRAPRATPGTYLLQDKVTMLVYPVSSTTQAQKMTVVAALAPTRTASVVPNYMFDEHVETIVAGAIARLTAVPGQTYTNPELVGYYMKQYRAGVAEERVDVSRGDTRKALTVRQRPLA